MELLNYDATEVLTFDPYNVLQGEGKFVGLPTTLIRFGQCNLRCNFCDSAYNWDKYTEYKLKDILAFIRKNIMFTGGEPLMNNYRQKFIYSIIQYHKQKINDNFIVEIETNGTNFVIDSLIDLITSFNISPKENRYQLDNRKTEVKLLEQINALYNKYIVKFVYDATKDNERFIYDIIDRYKLKESNIYIMPKGQTKDELLENIEKAYNFAVKNNFLLTPRMHILLFKETLKNWPAND